MKLAMLPKINSAQREHMDELVRLCCAVEPIRLSIPLPQADVSLSDERFFTLYDGDRLISLVHLFYPDQEIGELIGFTHPDYRGRGYFRDLLDMAADYADAIGLSQVYVISDGNSADAVHALNHLGLEAEYVEYMLKKSLTPTDVPLLSAAPIIAHENQLAVTEVSVSTEMAELFSEIFKAEADQCVSYLAEISSDERIHTFLLTLGDHPLGQSQITLMDDLAYVSGFGILPEHRRQGFGLRFLQLLEQELLARSITDLTLQVSNKNKPALSLYEKDGFKPLEALHYSPLFEEE